MPVSDHTNGPVLRIILIKIHTSLYIHGLRPRIMEEQDFRFVTGGDPHLEYRTELGSGCSASVHEVPS